MRHLGRLMMTILMAVACWALVACGHSVEDSVDDIGTGVGIHRIDVHFSVDKKKGINTFCSFEAIGEDGQMLQLYENGKKVAATTDVKTWNVEEMRDISVKSEDGCGSMDLKIIINGYEMNPIPSDVTVTIVGYVNNKRIKNQVETIPAGMKIMEIEFGTGHEDIRNAIIK